jgi:signal recognition particle GTPase
MSQQKNKLRVKYSNFQTNMSFNEWAQTFQVSTLVPEQFNKWDKRLDKCDEQTRRLMITSLYDNDVAVPISQRILSSIKQLINKNRCQEKTD